MSAQGAGSPSGYTPDPMTLPMRADSLPAYVRRQAPDNLVIQQIWEEGMMRSHASEYLQVLSDSLGPRLTGSTGMDRSQHWLQRVYQSLGIPVRLEKYGTWEKWDRGVTHLDLIAPRARTLDATMLGWSPGTNGHAIEGAVVVLPAVTTAEALTKRLRSVRGKIVMISAPRISCRSTQQWDAWGTPESRTRLKTQQDSINASWAARLPAVRDSLFIQLRKAGAVAILSSRWSGYPGIQKVFGSLRQSIPTVSVSCEDYGLLARLVERNQHPRVRLSATAHSMGEQPVFNVIGEIKGREKPNEYVVLSAHFDSWDGGSGTTDNGTGSAIMLDAMRILRTVYPNPKRTILVGHWSGEEEGLNGSRAFTEDHPEVVAGLQAAFTQDNGTGRVVSMDPGALPKAEPVLLGYLSQIPSAITQWIRWAPPNAPATGGSDHASFACYGAPSFFVGSLSWDYGATTWHTNVDTYDKVVVEDLKNNATLLAMLTYLASEDPVTMPRERLNPLPNDPNTGQPMAWPECPKAIRRSADYKRVLF